MTFKMLRFPQNQEKKGLPEKNIPRRVIIYYHKGLTNSGQQHLEAWTDDYALAVWHQEDLEL